MKMALVIAGDDDLFFFDKLLQRLEKSSRGREVIKTIRIRRVRPYSREETLSKSTRRLLDIERTQPTANDDGHTES